MGQPLDDKFKVPAMEKWRAWPHVSLTPRTLSKHHAFAKRSSAATANSFKPFFGPNRIPLPGLPNLTDPN